jgi:hypothetical protein
MNSAAKALRRKMIVSDGGAVIRGSNELQVYTTMSGYACIKQFSDLIGKEVTIMLTADQVTQLAGALQVLGGDRENWEFRDDYIVPIGPAAPGTIHHLDRVASKT